MNHMLENFDELRTRVLTQFRNRSYKLAENFNHLAFASSVKAEKLFDATY